jgi:hypothetical protein
MVMRPIFSAPGLDQSLVLNMDQTPVYMSMCPSMTLDLQGKKGINGKKTDNGSRFTACLGVSANGDKLKPFLIFKGKAGGTIDVREFGHQNRFAGAAEAYLCAQESGWQDGQNMLRWIDAILVPYLQEKVQGRIIPIHLLLDHFSVHWTEAVQERLQALGVTCHKVPAGCTGLVQPIDVGIGKPFKDRVRELWWLWQRQFSEDQGATESTKLNLSEKRELAIEWVNEGWATITPEIVRNSWRKTDYSFFV